MKLQGSETLVGISETVFLYLIPRVACSLVVDSVKWIHRQRIKRTVSLRMLHATLGPLIYVVAVRPRLPYAKATHFQHCRGISDLAQGPAISKVFSGRIEGCYRDKACHRAATSFPTSTGTSRVPMPSKALKAKPLSQ